jgi:hypothetical protein
MCSFDAVWFMALKQRVLQSIIVYSVYFTGSVTFPAPMVYRTLQADWELRTTSSWPLCSYFHSLKLLIQNVLHVFKLPITLRKLRILEWVAVLSLLPHTFPCPPCYVVINDYGKLRRIYFYEVKQHNFHTNIVIVVQKDPNWKQGDRHIAVTAQT